MKSGYEPKSTQPKLQESDMDEGCNKVSSKISCSANELYALQYKPLLGKCFYLDLQFSRKTEALEKDIKKLGGTIEKFFSKDIRYLISDKREARCVQQLGRNLSVPSPSSVLSPSSPHPSNNGGSPKSPVKRIATSRGKSLLEKVIKDKEQIQVNRILSSALSWGIKILYIDDVLSYIEKKKRDFITLNKAAAVKKNDNTGLTEKPSLQKSSVGRIRSPFIKIEDSSRHYKPIYVSMPYLPELNFTTEPPCMPFLAEGSGKIGHGKKLEEHEVKDQERRDKPFKTKEKKHGGYCECCVVKYESLQAHLNSEQHRAFLKSDVYSTVDRLISELEFNFGNLQNPTKKRKVSVSSAVHVSSNTLEGEKEDVGDGDDEDMDMGSLWDLAMGRSTPQQEGGEDKVSSGCSLRRPASSYGPTGYLCHPAEGATSDKTLVSVFRQTSDTSVTGISLSCNNRQVAGTDKKLPHFPEDLEGSSAAKHVKVAHSREGVTELHGDQVPVPTAEQDQSPNIQWGIAESSSSNASEMQRLRKVKDFKRQWKPSEGPLEEGNPVRRPLQNLWQLFESSENMDFEFGGFD